MKLLFESIERSEIDSARILLESRGIPIFVGNEDSARNFGLVYPARKYALWVCIDEQYEDALALLDNNDHEIRMPVDIQEYHKSFEQLRSQNTQKLFNGLMLVLVAVITLIFAMAVIG